MFQPSKSKKDRSLAYLHAESSTASMENAGIAFQSAALLSAGSSTKEIALLTGISNSLYALFLLKVPSVVKQGDSLKRVVVILSAIGALGWLPLILVPLFFKNIPLWLLITLWVINLVPSLIAGPLTDKWISDMVPPNKLARYLGIRAVFAAMTYLSCFYVMGFLLDTIQGGVLNGFSLIFTMAFLGSLGSLVLCLLLRVAVPFGEDSQTKFGLAGFIKEAKQNNLGILILFTASIIFTSSLTGPLYSVYMLNDLHFSYVAYTLVISIEYIARIAASYIGGRWIDNAGAIKVLRFASAIIPFLPILWLFSANVGYLMFIQVLSGIAWATYDLCVQSYLCKDSPPNKRLHYIVYQRSIVTVAAASGPLLGTLLLNYIYPIWGNPILGIFLLSGCLRLLVVLAMLPRLKNETKESDEPVEDHRKIIGTCVIKPMPVIQPYYRDNRAAQGAAISMLRNKASVPGPGPFHYLENRDLNSKERLQPVQRVITGNVRQDRLYRGGNWSKPPVQVTVANEVPGKVLRLKDNLERDIEYHKRWASRVTCTP